MKDYSINEEQRKRFICSYKIKDGKILLKLPRKRGFINFFKKNVRPVPYTKENEQLALEKMEAQVPKSDTKFDSDTRTMKVIKDIYTFFKGVLILGIFVKYLSALFSYPVSESISLLANLSLGTLLLGSTVFECIYVVIGFLDFIVHNIPNYLLFVFSSKIAEHNSKKKDLEKSQLFMKNKELFNKHLGNENAIRGLSRKAITKIEEAKTANRPFNINDIDTLPLKDLRKLKANIEMIMGLGFDEGTTTMEQGNQKAKV